MGKAFENIQLELRDTIDRLKCIEVLLASSRNGDIRFLCRVNDENKWAMILNQFLRREVNKGWYSFIGKKYFLHEGKMAYGWVLIFESEDLDKMSVQIRKMLANINEELFGRPLEENYSEHEELTIDWGSNHYNKLVSRRAKELRG